MFRYRSLQNMTDRTLNVRDTSDFPSLNGQHTTVLPCARTRKQNQSVNTRDLNSFPALGQELAPPPKPQKPVNNIRMATMLKKPPEPLKPERNKELDAGPSGSRLPNQAKDFPSLDGNQQLTKPKEITPSTTNSNGSWVSKAKTANESSQEAKKKAKKEPAAIKKKIAEAPKVPGPSDFPNLNKKLEPSKSNLAKLGNKKKTENPKKGGSSESNNSSQNVKRNGVQQQTTVENNSRKLVDNSKSINNNKENNKPKPKSPETQYNGAGDDQNTTKPVANVNNIIKASEPKKESSKKKETAPVISVLETSEESTMVTNNPKDKKKRKKNEIKELIMSVTMAAVPAATVKNLEQSQDNSHSKPNSLKIPPGFENSFHHTVRAPPGLMSPRVSNPQPQVQNVIKAPPGLSLNNNKQFEYLHPVGSTVRNKVLINNLVAALVPARDERFDTFERFKEMSTLFRKHMITAYDFYSYCVEALYPHSFESVFLELVLLLPDIQKQQVCHIYITLTTITLT